MLEPFGSLYGFLKYDSFWFLYTIPSVYRPARLLKGAGPFTRQDSTVM
jgi:hypothetical protein